MFKNSSKSKALYNLNISVSPLFSELAARTIVSNEFENIIKVHQEEAILRNKIVNRHLSEYTCLGSETGIFCWLLLPVNITGAEFEKLAAQQGVQVYAAERFVVGNSCPERAVRVSISATETHEELERGLIILKGLLKNLN
ncbi:aminotransferase class I/II-fold pyridoxal phosphate-dependent enzyme [Arthrobacter citreus]|nr:aminotransferase class I/II-fold pyridoxal phosphate-dependent enzyme [Arthrobacter citreus]